MSDERQQSGTCTQCGNEIVAWMVHEIWSNETKSLLNDDPRQLCNSCAYNCDGMLSFADPNEMNKLADSLPRVSFEDYLKSIPGMSFGSSGDNDNDTTS